MAFEQGALRLSNETIERQCFRGEVDADISRYVGAQFAVRLCIDCDGRDGGDRTLASTRTPLGTARLRIVRRGILNCSAIRSRRPELEGS